MQERELSFTCTYNIFSFDSIEDGAELQLVLLPFDLLPFDLAVSNQHMYSSTHLASKLLSPPIPSVMK